MSKGKKASLLRLSELQPYDHGDVFAQLSDKSLRHTREGKPFYTCRFRDRHRTVSAVIWVDSPHYDECQKLWSIGSYFKIRGTYIEHERYGPPIDIEQIRGIEDRDRSEGFDEVEFQEVQRADVDSLFAELLTISRGEISDDPLRALVERMLLSHERELKLCFGSSRHYYPYPGGWVTHTLNVVQNCLWLVDRYVERFPELNPTLNRNLVIAGAFLHDIGRVQELELNSNSPVARATVIGELFGHVFLADHMIRDVARDIPDLHPELLDLLLHVVISHLRIPEWGSPRLPCIPEVLILHHADDLDAKFEMYARCLSRDTSDGPFTERDPILNRQLLKTRSV